MPLLVEAGWGGLIQYPWTITWTDMTQYVDDARGVTITRGAADELSDTQPGTATIHFDNQAGHLTPGNTGSPFYPFVRRNTPVRVSVAVMPTVSGSAPYPMAMLGDDFDDGRIDSARWPTNSGGAVETTSGRLRIPMVPGVDTSFASARTWKLQASQLKAKLSTVPAANGSSNAAASMWVTSTTSGTRIGWRYDALTGVLAAMSQVGFSDATPTNLTYSAIDHAWLRVRETSGTVYWETSSDGAYWTVRRSLATPAWIGSQTHAVDFPTTRTGGTAGFIEWDLVGAEIRPRFWGVVNEWPVSWEGLASKVQVSCTDLFKWLNRRPPLRSMLAEEILVAGPLAYYPLTETADATSVGDLSGAGAPALVRTQAGAGGTIALAGDDGPPATGEQVPLFTPASASAGKYFTADLGAAFQDKANFSYLAAEVWFKTTVTDRVMLSLKSPAGDYKIDFALESGTGKLQVVSTTPGSATSTVALATANLADGQWHQVVMNEPIQTVYVDGVEYGFGSYYTTRDIRLLAIGGAYGSRLWSGSLAHVAVYSFVAGPAAATAAAHYPAGSTGFAGEAADDRITRLAGYAGLSQVYVVGSTHDPIASQGEGGAGVTGRMREVETTESGRLFADRDYYGLTYQSRDVRYNPSPASDTFTIGYADLETSSVELADDDQKMVNWITASRPGGATQRVTAPSSITAFGIYDPGDLNILKTSDNSVLDAAYWRVSRYANPQPELREVPIEAYSMPIYLDILDTDISSNFSVFNLPAQAPSATLRVTVEGYTETIRDRSHLVQFHTSAAITDSVWVLDDSTYSVLGSTTRLAY